MSNDIETRDKAILDAIAKLSTDLNQRMEKLEENQTNLRVGQAEIKGEIKALDKKIDAVETRVSNLEFFNRVGVSSLIAGIIALIVKIFI